MITDTNHEELWRRGMALNLAAATGHPVEDWDRLLDAYAVAGFATDMLERDVAAGSYADLEPAVEAAIVESTFAYACGRIGAEVREALANLRSAR